MIGKYQVSTTSCIRKSTDEDGMYDGREYIEELITIIDTETGKLHKRIRCAEGLCTESTITIKEWNSKRNVYVAKGMVDDEDEWGE